LPPPAVGVMNIKPKERWDIVKEAFVDSEYFKKEDTFSFFFV
jgi:hypothetical protein